MKLIPPFLARGAPSMHAYHTKQRIPHLSIVSSSSGGNAKCRVSIRYSGHTDRTKQCGNVLTASWRSARHRAILLWSILIIRQGKKPIGSSVRMSDLSETLFLFAVAELGPADNTRVTNHLKTVQALLI